MHREDGPAVEYSNGDREWWFNGKRHRNNGPAIEWVNGTRSWYLNGELHREGAPAIESVNGTREWWLNGRNLSEEEFNKQKNIKNNSLFKRIKNFICSLILH